MTTTTPAANSFSLSPEPIAIVGIGCRFPGGSSGPQVFWIICWLAKIVLSMCRTAAGMPIAFMILTKKSRAKCM